MNVKDRIKEFRRIKASELRPHPKNWRKHPQAQQDALRGVLAEVGYVDALMVRSLPDGSWQIVDGHLRAETTPDAEVPCLVVDLDDSEAAKVLATFDPLAAMAEANAENLDALLREFNTGSEALSAMLDDLAKEAGCEWAKTGEVLEDEVPEPPVDPVTKPGDLWLLGEHRPLAGNRRALLGWLANTSTFRDIVTWDKGHAQPAMAGGVLDSRFEWLCVFGNGKQSRKIPLSSWRGTVQNVYAAPGQHKNEFSDVHAATFPVHLPAWGMSTLCNVAKWCIDPYAGSGTTIIAAEQLGRRCYGLELEPKYCDVICQRYFNLCGKVPVNEATGEAFPVEKAT